MSLKPERRNKREWGWKSWRNNGWNSTKLGKKDSRSSENPKQDNIKEIHSKTYHSQIFGKWRQRKKNWNEHFLLPIGEKQFKWLHMSHKKPGTEYGSIFSKWWKKKSRIIYPEKISFSNVRKIRHSQMMENSEICHQ